MNKQNNKSEIEEEIEINPIIDKDNQEVRVNISFKNMINQVKEQVEQAGLKGFQSGKTETINKVKEVIDELPIDVIKDYKTKKVRILIDKKELLQKISKEIE